MITGGASGIGECTARLFVKYGAKVVIADVQDDLGRSICADINGDDDDDVTYYCCYVHCDVTKECDVERAVNTAISKYGKLDIMYSNAGISGTKIVHRFWGQITNISGNFSTLICSELSCAPSMRLGL